MIEIIAIGLLAFGISLILLFQIQARRQMVELLNSHQISQSAAIDDIEVRMTDISQTTHDLAKMDPHASIILEARSLQRGELPPSRTQETLASLSIDFPLPPDSFSDSEVSAATLSISSSLLMSKTIEKELLKLPPKSRLAWANFASEERHLDLAGFLVDSVLIEIPGDLSALHLTASLAASAGDLYGEAKALDRILSQTPDDALLLRRRARLRIVDEDTDSITEDVRLRALGADSVEDRMLLAEIEQLRGESELAESDLLLAAEIDPGRCDTWINLATIHAERGRPESALEALDRALALDRRSGPAWALRARMLKECNIDLESAIKACVHAQALGEQPISMLLLRLELLDLCGRSDDAHVLLSESIMEQPNEGSLRASLIRRMRIAGDYSSAWKEIENAPQTTLSTVSMCLEIGHLALIDADLRRDGGGRPLSSVLSSAKQAYEGAIEIDRECAPAWAGLASVYRQQGELEASTKALERAHRLDTESITIHTEAILQAISISDMAEAEELCVRLESLEKEDPGKHAWLRGMIEMKRGRLDLARTHFSRTLAIEPDHIRSRINRARAHFALDDLDSSLDDYRHLLDLSDALVVCHVGLIDVLMSLGQWGEALSRVESLVEENPLDGSLLRRRGECLVSIGRPEQALGPLNDAISLEPDVAEHWHQRALMYLDLDEADAALADFETALKSEPRHLDALIHRAALHHDAERWDEARDGWRAVLDADPDHSPARQRLEEVETTISIMRD